VALAFLICSGVSVAGRIERLHLALAPETDSVKHVDAGEEPKQDSIQVEFEGMRSLMGENCPSFRVFLGKMTNSERPAPFWHIKPTDAEEDANMVQTKIAVAVRVSAAIKGEFSREGACTNLEHYVCPEVELKVLLPLYVNSRTIEQGEKLCFYKQAESEKKERKAPEEIDSLAAWKKQRTAVSKDNDTSKQKRVPSADPIQHHRTQDGFRPL
jgi:hypothetical protein